MKAPLLWIFALVAATTFFFACSEHMESSCTCASAAVQVIALDEKGTSISLDSIHYRLDSGATESMVLTNGNTAIVGTAAGYYEIWAFRQGQPSDTVSVEVVMGGPENCRNPVTQQITLIFTENGFAGHDLQKIGGCGDH